MTGSWLELSCGVPIRTLPRLLSQVFEQLPPDQRTTAIAHAWTVPPQPQALLRRDQWLAMFRAVGYHDGVERADSPERITLYRGGIWKARMAWIGTRSIAERFRDKHQVDDTRSSKLWTVTVGPDRLLAHYHLAPAFRYEDEYVIDPAGLHVAEVAESAADALRTGER